MARMKKRVFCHKVGADGLECGGRLFVRLDDATRALKTLKCRKTWAMDAVLAVCETCGAHFLLVVENMPRTAARKGR